MIIDKKILESEIESLKKLIEKIENKCYMSYIGIGIGAIISLIAIIYFMLNPDIITGSLCLLFVGGFVAFINYITLRQRKNRIEQLKKDLKVSEDLLLKN